jgi:hypothetical protein
VNSNDQLEAVLAELREWVADPFNESFMFQRVSNKLQTFSSSGVEKIGEVLESLTSLSTWYASVGIVEMFAGRSSDGLCDSFWCDYFHNTIMRLSFQRLSRKKGSLLAAFSNKQPRPTISFTEQGLLLAKSFAVGLVAEGEAIGQEALTGLQDGRYFGVSKLTPFVLSVFAKWKNIALPAEFSFDVPNPYQELVDDLTATAAKIGPAIAGACDFHLSRSKFPTKDEVYEFAGRVKTIYPVEILYVFRIRQILGLSNPEVDHPLMNSPLGKLPEAPCSMSESLKPIRDGIRRDFPEWTD